MNTMNQNIGAALRKLRKTAGISQEVLAKFLGLHQAALSRIEQGQQSLVPAQLDFLAHYFGIEISSLITGQINFWQVAERFGRSPPIPVRYQEHLHSKVRELLPLLSFYRHVLGEEETHTLLSKLSLESISYLSPDHRISSHCYLDLLRNALKQKILTPATLPQFIQQTKNRDLHDVLDPLYASHQSSIKLVQSYVLNSHFYEENFNFDLQDVKPKGFTILMSPNAHMHEIGYQDPILKDFLCHSKKKIISLFPEYIGAAPLTVTEKECHFKGSRQCIYKITA